MSEPFYYVRPDALKTREQILKLDDLEEWVQVIVIGKRVRDWSESKRQGEET